MNNELASYLPLIAHLRQLLAHAHKKAYTISVGKLNPAKLANFAEIECFVLVACPENSLVDAKVLSISTSFFLALSDQSQLERHQDFFRPIVTPFELQLALQPSPTWTGEYVLDFEEVLARGSAKPSSDNDEAVNEVDPDRPIFSLVTGKYRHAKRYGGELFQNPSIIFLFDRNTLQNPIRCLRRLHHHQPLFSEIKTGQSQHSGIVLLVCPFLFVCATYQRLNLFSQRGIPAITHVPWPRNAGRA